MFFSSITVVVFTICSHCTLQASLVQVILYLRVLLFTFYFIYIFMYDLYENDWTFIVKMKKHVVLNACHNNYWQGRTMNCETKIYVIEMEINV